MHHAFNGSLAGLSRQTTIFLVFVSAYFFSQFARSANAVIASDLAAEFSLDAAQLGLMTSLFFGTFALAQIPLGVALDRWGARWVTAGLMLFAVAGSILFALAQSYWMLALGRGLLGLGMAGILMGGLKMFSQWYADDRFATMTGLLTGIGATGALVAATPLAWLNEVIGWRAVFLIAAVLIGVNALAIVLWTHNAPAVSSGPRPNARSNQVTRILSDVRFWQIGLVMGMAAVGAFRGLWAGPYLYDLLRIGNIVVGNLLLLMGVGSIAGFLVAGWLCDRWGRGPVTLFLGLLAVGGMAALALPLPLPAVALVYVVLGLSSGMGVPLVAHAKAIFPATMTGQVLSLLNFCGFAGTFLLQWGMGLVISHFPTDAAGHYPQEAYATMLLLVASGSLVALFWYLPLLTRRMHPRAITGKE
jgi:predicted MFS family arabinose efflux permease